MQEHVCPPWIGYLLLLNPLRKLQVNPRRILFPFVREGMTVLEPGPALGYFSLPLARLVGESGRVVCVDVQEKMIRLLRNRAASAGLEARIDFRVCPGDSLNVGDLAGRVDFALAMYVLHEVPDPRRFLAEIFGTLKPGGTLLFAEPRGHVSRDEFASSVATARAVGFDVRDAPKVRGGYSSLLVRP